MKAYAKTNTSTSPDSSDVSTEISVNSFKGYFYNSEGEFLSREGGSNDVFLATEYIQNGTSFTYKEGGIRKLNITHEEFCYIAGVLYQEEHSSFEGAAAVTQTTFNAVKYLKGENLTIKQQTEYAKKLLSTNLYSTAPKRSLPDDIEKSDYMISRRGLIHVLTEGKDYSCGALLWDGVDFAAKGSKHVKANEEGGIEITEALWNQFIDLTSEQDLKNLYKQTKEDARKNIKFYELKQEYIAKFQYEQAILDASSPLIPLPLSLSMNQDRSRFSTIDGTSYWMQDGVYYRQRIVLKDPFISLGTGKWNKGRVLQKAVVVYGRQIYWTTNKDHPNNKGYLWKYFLDTSLI